MNKKIIVIIVFIFSLLAVFYFKNTGNYFNPASDNSILIKNNEKEIDIPAEIKEEIEQKSKRFIRIYNESSIDDIKLLLNTKNLISSNMSDNLTKKLNDLNNRQINNADKEQYQLYAELMEASIVNFERNKIKVKVSIKVSKTYGYLDEDWVTMVWRNPDGTIGNPPKEVYLQDAILDFVKFYDWRIDNVELENGKQIIYKNKLNE